MIFTLTPRHRLLYAVDFDPDPVELAVIHRELDRLPWQQTKHFDRRRYEAQPEPGSQLLKLTTEIKSLQYHWLEQLWTEQELMRKSVWNGTSLAQLQANCQPFCELLKDLPGMDTTVHVDHRSCVTAGMLFFNTEHDPKQSTEFYASEMLIARWLSKITMSSAYGQGWYTANHHRSWHRGANRSNRVRYSIKFGLYLPLDLASSI
jgi:hypothetical protein